MKLFSFNNSILKNVLGLFLAFLFITIYSGCTSFSEVKLSKEQLLANNGVKSMIIRNENNQIVEEESYYKNGKIKSYRSYIYPKNNGQKIIKEGSFYPNGKKKSESNYLYGFSVDEKGNSYAGMGITNYAVFEKRTTKYNEKERPIEEVHFGNNGVRSYLGTYKWNGDIVTIEEYQGSNGLTDKYVEYYDKFNNVIKSVDAVNKYTYQTVEYKYNDKGDVVYEKSIFYNKNGSISRYFEAKSTFQYNINKQLVKETKYTKSDPNSEFRFYHDISYNYDKNNKLIEKNQESFLGNSSEVIKYNLKGLIESKEVVEDNGKKSFCENYTYYDSGLIKTKETSKDKLAYTYIK